MFTSRAEHRLLFNHGSAELRLLHHARAHGLVSDERLGRIEQKKQAVEQWVNVLNEQRTASGTWGDRVRRREANIPFPEEFVKLPEAFREEVLYRVAYQGYLARELEQIAKMASLENMRIPRDLDFLQLRGLKRESALKLDEVRPFTLGQASRISGVNPADVHILMIHLQARGTGTERRPERSETEA